MTPGLFKMMSFCNLFALRILRAHGMNDTSLQMMFRAVAVSKLQYASQAWYGFANSNERDRIEAFLRKSKRVGFYPSNGASFDELCTVADARLFHQICTNKDHVLHRLLPPKQCTNYSLRKRTHACTLPTKTSKLTDSNFFM